ncbi:MAG: enoyl-CoA hydratase/isomerase family protein [Candidatus Binataceae bacterium]
MDNQHRDAREFETLKAEIEGAIGSLTLDRPERLNAINATMLLELAEAARWFDLHRELRVVIVKGAGRAFSAGADLQDSPMADGTAPSGNSWLYRREVGQYGLRACEALEQMRAVTIAQVHGYAVGGGVVLVAVCDFRVMADNTVMFIPEVDLGVPLAWGAIPRMVREIGPAMTKELVMTCRRFTAQEAQALGFVNRVTTADRLAAEAHALAEELASKPPVPVVMTKEHVNAVARAMAAGFTGYADGDLMLSSIREEESKAAAESYTLERIHKKRQLG